MALVGAGGFQTSADSPRCSIATASLLRLLPLKGNEKMSTTGCVRKLGGPLLSYFSKAQPASLLTEFVNPQVLIAFAVPFRHGEVDSLGILRGVFLD